jgi:hypothetical protein
MSGTNKWIVVISWGLPVLAASCFGQTPLRRQAKAKIERQPVVQRTVATPALPSGPLPQVPMNQIPSTPPQVSYQNGMLTIVAQNSNLADILREVHKRTGAVIDVPPNATERVITRLGPGPARDVLASLLNGSTFNYVMVGSTSDPTSLASITLTARPAGGAGETVANAAYQPPPQQYAQPMQIAPGMGPGGPVVQQQAAVDEEADAEEKDEEENNVDPDQDQAQTQGQADNGAVPPPDGSQLNSGPKTPEQILEMLRQHRQTVPGQVGAPGQTPPPSQEPPNND